jgi:hypothetical protein
VPLQPEQAGFAAAAQGARLRRQTSGRKPEEVVLITSASAQRLPAKDWLGLNRQGWGIEALHQKLDISRANDRSRVRHPNAMLVLGIFLRIANSLYMEWRQRHPKAKYQTTTNFCTEMLVENRRRGVNLVVARSPSLEPSG